MTRLNDEDIQSIIKQYRKNEELFIKNFKFSLLEIGNKAVNNAASKEQLKNLKVACIPITSGFGEISNFSQIVCTILTDCCGVNAFVTKQKNVAGIQEAYEQKSDIIFMADDNTFTAFHLKKNLYMNNGEATGRGFAAALDVAAGPLQNKEVLVLGAGPVACAGATYLLQRNAHVKMYDPCMDKVRTYIKKYPQVEMVPHWNTRTWNYILEATPSANIITENQVTSQTICAAPGVPFGLDEFSVKKCKLIIHNLLELGVATMLSGVCKEESHGKENYYSL